MVDQGRDAAARLLGVPVDAEPATVRRAFRLWAAVAHPDQGGSPEAFERLVAAREVLLTPVVPEPSYAASTDLSPQPRRPWSKVLVRPTPRGALGSITVVVAAVGVVPFARGEFTGWVLAVAAVLATAASVVAPRAVMARPDHGHVIVMRAAVWLAVVALQLLVSALFGVPMLEALPLMAVPFVAAIALVNPGAGLRLVNVR